MATSTNGAPSGQPEDFIDNIVEFEDGSAFERLQPLTDLRKDPGEGRIVYTCKRVKGSISAAESSPDEELVMKVKAQWPGPQNLMHEGPSRFTVAELTALQRFTDLKIANVPHLITWKKTTQPHDGIHPGGYIIYIIMTKLPGQSLWDMGYYSISDDHRDEIRPRFMEKLQEIRRLGIQPYDCALRNILWEKDTKQLSILDFEHYEESDDPVEDEKTEYQRWGLVPKPPPRTWFQEWGLKGV